jgi:hypothetical protein
VYPVSDDPLEVLLTPSPSAQTIAFPAIASHVYGSAPFSVNATSSLGSAFPVVITVQSGPATISGNTVTLTGVGTVVLLASQSGNAQASAASATQSFQVTPAPLTAMANNATRAYGAANPVFTGTITGAVSGDTFTESFTTPATVNSSPGSYPIVPAVSGAAVANYTVSIVNGTLTVTAGTPVVAPTTTILNAPATALLGAAVTLTATVASAGGAPSGSVTFLTGTTSIGTAPLNANGVATLTTTSLPAGTDSVTAAYAGSGTFSGSTSSAVIVTVTAAIGATTTTLTAPTSATYGSPLTLTAVVSAASGTPTGVVNFYYGAAALGTADLDSSGTAALSTTALPVGSDSVTAVYAGLGDFKGSTSAALTITITAATSPAQASYTLAANPSSLTVVLGQKASTTVILTPVGEYRGSVELGCINLPANMTCAFAQNQLTLDGSGQTAQMALTITTNGQNVHNIVPFPELSSNFEALVFWYPGGLAGLAILASKRKSRSVPWSAVIFTIFLVYGLAGCGRSGTAAYQPGNSQVTVFATGTSATAVTTQTAIITVRTTQ